MSPPQESNSQTPAAITLPSTIPASKPAIPLWLSILFASGWLLTALAWWWSWNKLKTAQKTPAESSDKIAKSSDILKLLKNSCQENSPTQARQLFMQWVQQQLIDEPNPSWQQIYSRVSQPLQAELELLEKNLFAKESTPWNGEKLWLEVAKMHKLGRRKTEKKNPSKLRPLYDPNFGS